tara:strand:+ start:441 stop:608 length:168 start_codon:yes stop_codon:yes gene_type:complete
MSDQIITKYTLIEKDSEKENILRQIIAQKQKTDPMKFGRGLEGKCWHAKGGEKVG